jgi:hypothetical protein
MVIDRVLVVNKFCQITVLVAERKGVDRLVWTPAHTKVSLSRPTATGGNEMCVQNYLRRDNSDTVQNGLSKPTDHVGQQAKDNWVVGFSQLV